jgi:hypothetical protein
MISYGYEVTSLNDEYVTLADEALALLGRAGLFGTYLVDYIPICECPSVYFTCSCQTSISVKHIPTWFPGADFKRKARKWKELTLAMKHWPYDLTKQRIVRLCDYIKETRPKDANVEEWNCNTFHNCSRTRSNGSRDGRRLL